MDNHRVDERHSLDVELSVVLVATVEVLLVDVYGKLSICDDRKPG